MLRRDSLAHRRDSALGRLSRLRAVGTSHNLESPRDVMSEGTLGFKARLEYVLDQVCVGALDTGSHEMRRFVAEKLLAAAQPENDSWRAYADSSPGIDCFWGSDRGEDCLRVDNMDAQ
jgi:hypothetical protein